MKKHGKWGSPEYKSWNSMKQRCTNPNMPEYKRYGGAGISFCSQWKDFSNFLRDMGERPPGTSLDRINGDLGYFIGNCRWATPMEQASHTKLNRYVKFNGINLHLSEWARRLGMKKVTLIGRIRAGWSIRDALTLPVDKWSSRRARH